MEQDKLYNCIYKFCLTLLRTIILRTTNIGFRICTFLYICLTCFLLSFVTAVVILVMLSFVLSFCTVM